ncbi:MAG: 2OG-Fe(II) oxygenase [Phenylobacterium sp.]|nr:MAG: 2OG-Fe(II) oxygenase [Phenylobacterium sp.]
MTLPVGVPAPLFTAPSPSNPGGFAFGSLGGRYIVLVFLPEPSPARDAAFALYSEHAGLFRDDNALIFGVLPDHDSFVRARDSGNGLRWFGDPDGQLRQLYRATTPDGALVPEWVLIDPTFRILAAAPLSEGRAVLEVLRAMGEAETHAGTFVPAPVLVVPRILEPAFCRELIAAFEVTGGVRSGVMRVIDGKTVPVVDDFKSRRDADIPPGPLIDGLRARIVARLAPEIEKAFQFKATRIERFIVSCYDAEEGGYFQAHRDNTTPGTAHRRFAVSINLNAEAFEGGDLRFPEFGRRTYRPPTGGAVVFSCSLLHEATPVTRGRRYATLPFLYDEAGARIREANLHTFARPQPAGVSPPP